MLRPRPWRGLWTLSAVRAVTVAWACPCRALTCCWSSRTLGPFRDRGGGSKARGRVPDAGAPERPGRHRSAPAQAQLPTPRPAAPSWQRGFRKVLGLCPDVPEPRVLLGPVTAIVPVPDCTRSLTALGRLFPPERVTGWGPGGPLIPRGSSLAQAQAYSKLLTPTHRPACCAPHSHNPCGCPWLRDIPLRAWLDPRLSALLFSRRLSGSPGPCCWDTACPLVTFLMGTSLLRPSRAVTTQGLLPQTRGLSLCPLSGRPCSPRVGSNASPECSCPIQWTQQAEWTRVSG